MLKIPIFLSKVVLLAILLAIPLSVIGQLKNGIIICHIANCKTPQNIKIYYLGKEFILLDSVLISGNNTEEKVTLKTQISLDLEEARQLISISPLGMGIDVVLAQEDSCVNAYFTLPEADLEKIYTTPIQFIGSKKATEYYNLNVDIWQKVIAVGKKRQILLKNNVANADSLQINWYKDNIYKTINIINNTSCLNCAMSCFYKAIGYMQTANNYFGTKLYSREELQKSLKKFNNRFPDSKVVKLFLDDIQHDVQTIGW